MISINKSTVAQSGSCSACSRINEQGVAPYISVHTIDMGNATYRLCNQCMSEMYQKIRMTNLIGHYLRKNIDVTALEDDWDTI